MGPKKKGGRRQEEDWEAELGETIPSANGEPAEQKPADDNNSNNNDDELEMGGGLLAALKKNRSKKAKKGKLVEDFVEGEDPTQPDANGSAVDLASKQPEEATFDDDDVFAGKPKKGKAADKPAPKEEPKEDAGEEIRVKSKKEKEKEKKEREKQRKKEQVGRTLFPYVFAVEKSLDY